MQNAARRGPDGDVFPFLGPVHACYGRARRKKNAFPRAALSRRLIQGGRPARLTTRGEELISATHFLLPSLLLLCAKLFTFRPASAATRWAPSSGRSSPTSKCLARRRPVIGCARALGRSARALAPMGSSRGFGSFCDIPSCAPSLGAHNGVSHGQPNPFGRPQRRPRCSAPARLGRSARAPPRMGSSRGLGSFCDPPLCAPSLCAHDGVLLG